MAAAAAVLMTCWYTYGVGTHMHCRSQAKSCRFLYRFSMLYSSRHPHRMHGSGITECRCFLALLLMASLSDNVQVLLGILI